LVKLTANQNWFGEGKHYLRPVLPSGKIDLVVTDVLKPIPGAQVTLEYRVGNPVSEFNWK